MSSVNENKSTLVSRNITVLGRRTSIRLEPEMWNALREISKRERCKIHDICSLIHLRKNKNTSLTAAIRVFLMLYYRAAATEEGHLRAGHGNFKSMMARARMTAEMIAECKTANLHTNTKKLNDSGGFGKDKIKEAEADSNILPSRSCTPCKLESAVQSTTMQ